MKTDAPPGIAGWPPPVLDPAGPFAGPIQTVAWVLFIMAAVVMVVVAVALGIALFGPRKWKRRVGGERLIWIAGLVFPVVVLTGLLVYGLTTTARVADAPKPGEMRVRVTGEMWWWRVAYLDDQGREAFQDANEIHIPTGRPVERKMVAPKPVVEFEFREYPKRFERAVVVPWHADFDKWESLRMCLRSIHANFKDRDCPIVVLGTRRPGWLLWKSHK